MTLFDLVNIGVALIALTIAVAQHFQIRQQEKEIREYARRLMSRDHGPIDSLPAMRTDMEHGEHICKHNRRAD